MGTQSAVGRSGNAEPDRSLGVAALLYGGAFVVHNADHARRGIEATPEALVWAGTGIAMLTAVILTMIAVRHPQASLFAAAGGATIAVGVTLSHMLPKWGPLSDPLPGGRVDAFTWFAVIGEIAGAIVLALAGLRALRTAPPTNERATR